MYVGNLHVTHLQTVLMFFEAGKPVLCEKPLTTSVKSATTMIQAAKNKGLFLMEVRNKIYNSVLFSIFNSMGSGYVYTLSTIIL